MKFRRRMPGLGTSGPAWDTRLEKLAQDIDALTAKDDDLLRHAHEIFALRRSAAAELYAICADFVDAVNARLAHPVVKIDPCDASEWKNHDAGVNLIQINVKGRILQVEHKVSPELISTEEFRIPYTLSGSVRAFNQELLDKDLIEEQLLFYTIERHRKMWRYFDARTYRSGPFDRGYLISLMEQVV